jgi:hypothetical protein
MTAAWTHGGDPTAIRVVTGHVPQRRRIAGRTITEIPTDVPGNTSSVLVNIASRRRRAGLRHS